VVRPLFLAAMGRGNSVEVELKYLGPDLADTRRRLLEAGAKVAGPRELETNVVFDDERQSLRNSERLLRLRNGEELTVKLPVQDDQYKSRREITIHGSGGSVAELLGGLGFRPTWAYEKYREGFDMDGMFVTLDELPFVGAVVEIEGDRERIDETAARLGLASLTTSTASYRTLYEEYAAANGISRGDMTWEAEAALRH
ncbi:MAG: class IV adenylate cyclase, partial [Candidatus Dormibacteria bacterium]